MNDSSKPASQILLVERGSPVWKKLGTALAQMPINEGDKVCFNSVYDACWEYLGFWSSEHHFKHKMHPKTKKVETVSFSELSLGH